MRTIKFREWDQEREDMMPGHGMSYSEREEFDDSVSFRFEHEEDLDYTGRQSETDCNGTPYRALEQFTGLTDVNGKDIYEGDILKVTSDDGSFYVATVKWFGDSGYPAFDLEGIPSFCNYDANALATIFESSLETCEVIGNIFENPELLEAEK